MDTLPAGGSDFVLFREAAESFVVCTARGPPDLPFFRFFARQWFYRSRENGRSYFGIRVCWRQPDTSVRCWRAERSVSWAGWRLPTSSISGEIWLRRTLSANDEK